MGDTERQEPSGQSTTTSLQSTTAASRGGQGEAIGHRGRDSLEELFYSEVTRRAGSMCLASGVAVVVVVGSKTLGIFPFLRHISIVHGTYAGSKF